MGTSHTSPDQIKFDYPIRNFLSNFGTKKVAFHDFKEQTELLKSVERRKSRAIPFTSVLRQMKLKSTFDKPFLKNSIVRGIICPTKIFKSFSY